MAQGGQWAVGSARCAWPLDCGASMRLRRSISDVNRCPRSDRRESASRSSPPSALADGLRSCRECIRRHRIAPKPRTLVYRANSDRGILRTIESARGGGEKTAQALGVGGPTRWSCTRIGPRRPSSRVARSRKLPMVAAPFLSRIQWDP